MVRSTDTPEIEWPVPRDPRIEVAAGDTREPTRRTSRVKRGVRLRWALAWLSLVFGAISAWLWLARQDEYAERRLAVIRQLRELAAMRVDLQQAEEIRPATLRLYVQQAESRHQTLLPRVDSLAGESAIQQGWSTEQEALQEARADLIWLEPRMRQLDVIQGTKLTDEIKTNEASLRPALDRFSSQDSCPGARFRPGLARSLRTELDRRMREVTLASSPARYPALPFLEQRPTTTKPVLKKAKASRTRTKVLAVKAKTRAKAKAGLRR